MTTRAGETEGQSQGESPQTDSGQQPNPPPAPLNEGTVETPDYKHPCDYPNSREDSELCAQWTAATAAEDAARHRTQ